MEIMLIFVDGATMTYNTAGVLVRLTDQEGNVDDASNYTLGNGCPDIHGIWDDDNKYTIPWTKVVDYEHTGFTLMSNMYIDNGQVTEEGEIVQMIVNEGSGMTTTWSVSVWDDNVEGDENVYCRDCDTYYEVKVNLDGYKPHWCSFCGSTNLSIKEEN